MATVAQIAANQQNAQCSTGPQTPEGKAAASRNATTHGLHAADPVLAHESQDEFDALHDLYREELAPEGIHEDFLVRQVAEAQWRLARIQRIEAEFVDLLASGQPRRNPNAVIAASMLEKGGPEALLRIHRLAASAERAYHRNYNALICGRRDAEREAASRREAAVVAHVMAPMPKATPSTRTRQNEPNRAAAAQTRPSVHTRNEGSLALRL